MFQLQRLSSFSHIYLCFFGPKASGSQPYSPRAKNSATYPGPRRNPTIKISRATRVQEQWNASLDREITDTNELRHLDEFLGNQVCFCKGFFFC